MPAAAALNVLWPETYSGKFGVARSGAHAGSGRTAALPAVAARPAGTGPGGSWRTAADVHGRDPRRLVDRCGGRVGGAGLGRVIGLEGGEVRAGHRPLAEDAVVALGQGAVHRGVVLDDHRP